MRRLFAILISLFVFSLCACTEGVVAVPTQSPALTPSASPSPSPAPVAPRVLAVFGAEDASAFLDGIKTAAEGSGIDILPVSGGLEALASYQPDGATAAIVYLPGAPEALPHTSIPIYVFAANGQYISLDIPHLAYSNAIVPKLALSCALSYPPHLAPVRMIGLFSSESSRAYALWAAAKTSGDVFAKQEYFADASEATLADWLADVFSRYYPGMLDAVYAETGTLSVAAADSLASLGRDDIEVFSAGTESNATAKLSPILICTVGANLADASARCYTEALKLLSGDTAQTGVLLPETNWYTANP